MKLIVLVFLITNLAFASNQYIKGTGRFYVEEEDGLNFLKKELVQSAIQNVITKELKSMKLDPDLFWQSYEAKFEEYFSSSQEALAKKYKEGEEGQTAEQKKKYNKALRVRRLLAKRKFGNLKQVVTSYTNGRISRSTQYPKVRFLNLEAKVDQKLLYDLYYRFITNSEAKNYEKIYLTLDFKLEDDKWNILEVEQASQFTNAIIESWQKWLATNSGFENIKVIGDDENNKQKLATHAQNFSTTLETDNLLGADSNLVQLGNEYASSLWVELIMRVNIDSYDEKLKSVTLSFDGEVIFHDLRTTKIFAIKNIEKTLQTYQLTGDGAIASQVASYVYRLPLEPMRGLKQELEKIPSNIKFRTLEVVNIDSMNELNLIGDFIKSRAITFRASVQPNSYSMDKATLRLEFQGAAEEMRRLLQSLDSKVFSESKKVFLPYENNPFFIYLAKKEESNRSLKEKFKRVENDDKN